MVFSKGTRVISMITAATMASCALTACAPSTPDEKTNADGEIVVDMWHSASGAANQTLQEIVSDFNESHEGEIEINASYQGGYGDSIAKFISSVQTGELPALMQANDVQTAWLYDSKLSTPAEDLGDGYDFGGLVDAVQNYYTIDDKIQSMPFMVSQPGMYVNDDVLEDAGVDPDSLDSMDGLLDAAEKIHDRTGMAGLTFHNTGWWVEEFQAAAGEFMCSPENGTGANRPKEFNLDSQTTIDLWSRIGELYKSGAIHNPGSGGDASNGAFIAKKAGIMINSSGNYGNVIDGNPSFNWSIHSLPSGTKNGGAVPGGNSLWAIKEGHSERTQEAAWEFMKYVGSDEVQQKIFNETGYLPTTSKAAEELNELTPQQQGLINQLEDTPSSQITAGCKSGALNDARTSYESAMSAIANGADAKDEMTRAKKKADASIENYNRRAENTKGL